MEQQITTFPKLNRVNQTVTVLTSRMNRSERLKPQQEGTVILTLHSSHRKIIQFQTRTWPCEQIRTHCGLSRTWRLNAGTIWPSMDMSAYTYSDITTVIKIPVIPVKLFCAKCMTFMMLCRCCLTDEFICAFLSAYSIPVLLHFYIACWPVLWKSTCCCSQCFVFMYLCAAPFANQFQIG